jgi:hypothetical protein
VVAVVGGLELDIHEVDRGGRGADKEDLHGGVVHGDEVGHQVQVARHEHHQEQDLRLAGDAGARARLPDLGIGRGITHRMLTFAQSSVAHPEPDPYVFGPPGSRSGSISTRYGSGSVYDQAILV